MSDTNIPPSDPPNRDYKVGYGKPPVRSRFQKGQRANPKGRPKSTPVNDIAALFESISQQHVSIIENGKPQRVSKMDAMLRRQVIDAVKGDTRAARSLLHLALKHGLAKKIVQKSFIVIDEFHGELGDLLRIYNRQTSGQITSSSPIGKSQQ